MKTTFFFIMRKCKQIYLADIYEKWERRNISVEGQYLWHPTKIFPRVSTSWEILKKNKNLWKGISFTECMHIGEQIKCKLVTFTTFVRLKAYFVASCRILVSWFYNYILHRIHPTMSNFNPFQRYRSISYRVV